MVPDEIPDVFRRDRGGPLIDAGQQHVLVDTGAGGFALTNRQLYDNLRAEGVDLLSIDVSCC
jgi:hypothetical protein